MKMNIEQLSPEKLRVVLNSGDLDKYKLNYTSISPENPGTRLMVRDILAEAQNATGFSTKNCKLLIEVLPGRDKGCVLYLTKSRMEAARTGAAHEQKKNAAPCQDMPEPARSFEKRQTGYIFVGENLEDTIGAVNCFAGYPDIPVVKSSLYDLDGKYQLCFSTSSCGLDRSRLLSLLTTLSEYGNTERSDPVKEAVIREHGYMISGNMAVEKMLRYFC